MIIFINKIIYNNIMNKTNKNNQNYDDIRINIPKDKIQHENIKQESLLVKILKKLNIL